MWFRAATLPFRFDATPPLRELISPEERSAHPAALLSLLLYSSWGSTDTYLPVPKGQTTLNTITEQETLG